MATIRAVRSVSGIKDAYTRRILSNIIGRDVMTVYTSGGYKMKAVFKAIFTAPDFVMF